MERANRNPLTDPSSLSPAGEQAPAGTLVPENRRYGAQARYYDYEYRTYTDDIPFYLDQLRTLPRDCRVLELGVGTGRVAFPLVEAGFQVVGIDLSAPMLRRARARKKALSPAAASRLSLHKADLLRWRSGRSFQAVIAPFSFFCLLPTRSLRQAALQRVFELLDPGGLCVVDVFKVQPWDDQALDSAGAMPMRTYQQMFVIPPYGHQVYKTVTEQFFPHAGYQEVHYTYEEKDWTGARAYRTLHVEFPLASVPEDELLADFLDAGFEIEAWAGDYQGRPPGPKSGRLIVTGRKPRGGFLG